MRQPCIVAVLLAVAGTILGGCGAREEVLPAPPPSVDTAPATEAEPESPPQPAESGPLPAPTPEAAAPLTEPDGAPAPPARPEPTRTSPAKEPDAKPAGAATPTTAPVATPTPPPAPTASPAVAPPSTPAAASGLVDPGGEIAVAPGKAGVARVGVDKCRVCHKVQHTSWAASGHAKRVPPLDCEGCHGPGSEYRPMAVMKDPARARAAGLVEPDAAFCARCHTGTPDRAFFERVHAHKTAP